MINDKEEKEIKAPKKEHYDASSIQVLEGLEPVEVGVLGAALQEPFAAHVELVLEEQFKELDGGEAVGGGFLDAQV